MYQGLKVVFFTLSFVTVADGIALAGSSGSNFLAQMEEALVSLADKVRPSVVSLSAYVPPSPSVPRQGDTGNHAGAGSGVIIDGVKGIIVTNHHVVRGSGKVKVTLLGGEEKVGTVLGADEDTDLAVVQIDIDKEPLPSAKFGDSSKLRIGQFAVAVGNPYGLNDTFTFGIISGLNRENVNLSRYEDFIQTDTSINPGNSGGPLLNIQGDVIGINTAIINYAQSIGFAIPSNIVRKVVDELLKFGEVQRGWLGVGIEQVTREIAQQTKAKEGEGVRVNSVFEGDPAHRAGLRIGDIILRIGGAEVDTPSRMIRLIGSFSPGQTISIDILRNGKRETVSVKLESQKSKHQRVVKKFLPDSNGPSLGLKVESTNDGGVIVSMVLPGSSAERGGLKTGDRIEAINGRKISKVIEFKEIMASVSRGSSAHLLVQRNKEKFHLALVQ